MQVQFENWAFASFSSNTVHTPLWYEATLSDLKNQQNTAFSTDNELPSVSKKNILTWKEVLDQDRVNFYIVNVIHVVGYIKLASTVQGRDCEPFSLTHHGYQFNKSNPVLSVKGQGARNAVELGADFHGRRGVLFPGSWDHRLLHADLWIKWLHAKTATCSTQLSLNTKLRINRFSYNLVQHYW